MWSPASTSTCFGWCETISSRFWYTASAVPRYQLASSCCCAGPTSTNSPTSPRPPRPARPELAPQVTPAVLHVLDERLRLVLGEDRDLADAGVDAVGEHE